MLRSFFTNIIRRMSKGRARRPGQVRGQSWAYRPEVVDLESRTLLSTIAWLRPVGGDWDTPANWAGGHVPAANDTAVIPFRGITVTHATAAADTAASLDTEAALDISAGSLTLLSGSRLDALVTVNDGTLSFINSVTGTGTLRNFATLNLGADISEEVVGDASIAVGNEAGVLTVFGAINNDIGRPFVNGTNATLVVGAPGLPHDSAVFANGFTNQGHIENHGQLDVTNGILVNAPGGSIVGGDVVANLDNQGTITDSDNIGRAGGTVTNEGTITVHHSSTPGVALSVLGGSFAQSGAITGDGTLHIQTTTAEFLPGAVNTVANPEVVDSTLTSPTPLTNLTLIVASTINAAVVNPGTLNIAATFVETSATSTINGPLTNAAGATLSIIAREFGGTVQSVNLTVTQDLANNGTIVLAGLAGASRHGWRADQRAGGDDQRRRQPERGTG
jgi:hypothetical protein